MPEPPQAVGRRLRPPLPARVRPLAVPPAPGVRVVARIRAPARAGVKRRLRVHRLSRRALGGLARPARPVRAVGLCDPAPGGLGAGGIRVG